jgi:ABC-type Fe3+ transport system substrate-binding protein
MLVRGQVAIAVGTTAPVILDFVNQGFKNVKRILPDDFSYLFQETVWVMNRAPHPAAAKLFVNWLLTKQAQEVYAAGTEFNSRRKDVAPVNQTTLPPAGAETKYLDMLRQNRYAEAERIRAITRELLK